MKFGIFSRSTAGFALILLLLGASNVYAIIKLVQFNGTILNSMNPLIQIMDVEKRLEYALLSQRRYEQKYFLTNDRVLYDQYLAEKEDFEQYLREINAPSRSPAAKLSIEAIHTYHQHYKSLIDEEIQYKKERRSYDKNQYSVEKGEAVDAILHTLEGIEGNARSDILQITKMVSEAGMSTRSVAVASLLLTTLIAILLSFIITSGITKPLIKLVRKTREIPNGVFDCKLDVSAPPEINELAEAFNTMCDRLKEVERMKADFFSMISHELRTPLTTIREGTGLLLERGTDRLDAGKQTKLLTIIDAETKRLTKLVNSILDLSKMEAGMMTYAFEQRSIATLIDMALTELAPYLEAKKIQLERRIAADLCLCRMDRERMLDALRNLLGNAIKFTPEKGKITVAAARIESGLEVSISDTGPGIPRANMETIFDKYASYSQKKGTGLGLAIVKYIIAAHEGKVWAESELGKGSRFIFVLPC